MPKIVDHDAYRRELLDRSYSTFVKYGYAACTTRLLAKEIGVSMGTLYHYFKTKEDVFEQLVQEKTAHAQARILDLVAAHPQPMTCRDMFVIASELANERREQQLLLMEYQRQTGGRPLGAGNMAGWQVMTAKLLGIDDATVIGLITSALAGAILMNPPLSKAAFAAQGGLFDELLAGWKKPQRRR